jgi:hypothetical protein
MNIRGGLQLGGSSAKGTYVEMIYFSIIKMSSMRIEIKVQLS